MNKRIVILQGHPDAGERHFCHALADAYARGAQEDGHHVDTIDVASLEFPLIRSKKEWEHSPPPPCIVTAQEQIRLADHLLLIYPLWMGFMPAILKAFMEQAFRPGFALKDMSPGKLPQRLMKGKSARVVVTMGMPSLVYRFWFGSHSLKALEQNVLGFAGVKPVHSTVIGGVDDPDGASVREQWLEEMGALGRRAG